MNRRTPALVPQPRGGRRHRAAFLLLEVVVAVGLLAIGLAALVDGLGRCVAAARSVERYGTAARLLANKSYEFRVERPTEDQDQEGVFGDEPAFSWSRRFTATDSEGLWHQTITVYWYERGQIASDSVDEYRFLPNKQR